MGLDGLKDFPSFEDACSVTRNLYTRTDLRRNRFLDSPIRCKEQYQNTSCKAAACSKIVTVWPALVIPMAAASPLMPHPTIAIVQLGRAMACFPNRLRNDLTREQRQRKIYSAILQRSKFNDIFLLYIEVIPDISNTSIDRFSLCYIPECRRSDLRYKRIPPVYHDL